MSSRRSRRPSKKEKVDTNSWMTTYTDMTTLLLAFFILIFSFSIIDVERFERILASIQLSFLGHTGILDSPPEISKPIPENLPVESGLLEQEEAALLGRMQEIEKVKRQVEEFLESIGLKGSVEVREEHRGVVMNLPDHIFFERSCADLRPEACTILDKLADLFRQMEHRIVVEGHTCDLPINLPLFPSNWELSVIRSVRVTRYLAEKQGLKANRFTATGFGEYQPLQSNETAEGRAANRRVTFVITIE